ncbi:VPLPA-CTERM sorting domain-containing protein [Paracoccus sp. SY]|uniref:VPLPA-CTERM sorting domain-containing protein n=1 Tax=Paracoccus sp. SY TaxID=1330255 RepID=UPI000CD09753|nr:VPLPA-CTERM sorting domain-containing protein [Paracoccus sp. SY]
MRINQTDHHHGSTIRFLKGQVMSFKTLCAATAVVVGLSSAADAASVHNVGFSLNEGGYCEPQPCTPPSNTGYFLGFETNKWYSGKLRFSDPDELGQINISFSDSTWPLAYSLGQYTLNPASLEHYHMVSGLPDFIIRWDGEIGEFYYRIGSRERHLEYSGSFRAIPPVPLPASAALLPLGLGALAMMRRRRKS